jgi:membrane-bound lytic murein transglycosylase
MYGEVNILYGAYVAIQGQLAKRRTEAQIQVLTAQKAVENVETEDEKKQAERKLTAARAREKEIIERTKRETGALARNLYAWAQSKPEPERVAWAEALHHVSSRGNGKGGVMLYAFPQELVDAVASATGGGRIRVKLPKLGALMRVEANSFYLEGEEGRTFLFRYNPENRMVSR